MRRSSARRATAIIASAIVIPMLASAMGANAATTALWIEQNGNGGGDTAPMLTDFTVRDVLFNGARFPLPNQTTQRPGMKKYAAYGAVPLTGTIEDEVLARVALSVADEGTTWSEPRQITIRDTDTAPDVPLIVNDPSSAFAVAFGDLPQAIQSNGTGGNGPGRVGLQFALYYRDREDGGANASNGMDGIHVAVSADGALFEFDQPLLQAAGVDPVLGGAAWKDATYGPSQIIFIPNGSTTCHTGAAAANFPWNCRAIMLYNAVGTDGRERVGLAGSGDGVNWRGMASPLLDVGLAGAWDDEVASYAKVIRMCGAEIVGYTAACGTGEQWVLYYQGGRLPDSACSGGGSGCFSIGVATAPKAAAGGPAAFTKVAHNPVTPASLFEQADPGAPASLWYPAPVDDDSPATCASPGNTPKIFVTSIRGGSSGPIARGFWQARHGTAPSAGPSIRVDNPINGNQPLAEDRLAMYLTDTLGTPGLIGVNMATLAVNIDGSIPLALKSSKSIVGALKFPSFKVTADKIFAGLADGTHVLNVSVADLEGNVSVKAVNFILDRAAPNTTMLVPAPSPQIGILDSIGAYDGETTDALTPLLGLRAIVRNPLGMTKVYEVRETCGKWDTRSNGFVLLEELNGGKTWKWRWVAPSLDLHTALPGPYTVTVVGFDANNNLEDADAQNTATVLNI